MSASHDDEPRSVSWNSKYWDLITQLYWTPNYLGLNSIPKSNWEVEGEFVRIPKSSLNLNSGIYNRINTAGQNLERLWQLEEPLNHIFDITFAIAPDELIEKFFFEKIGVSSVGPFTSLGREVRQRYNWGNGNITQQDGLFSSPNSVVGIELKLGSRSSRKQIAQYIALFCWEELYANRELDCGLLFISPNGDLESLVPELELNVSEWIKSAGELGLSRKILELFDGHPERIFSISRRLKIALVTWKQHFEDVMQYRADIAGNSPGEQTLKRLLDGYLAQLKSHRFIGL